MISNGAGQIESIVEPTRDMLNVKMFKSRQPTIITQLRAPSMYNQETNGRTFFVMSIFGSTAPTSQYSTTRHIPTSRLGQEKKRFQGNCRIWTPVNLFPCYAVCSVV